MEARCGSSAKDSLEARPGQTQFSPIDRAGPIMVKEPCFHDEVPHITSCGNGEEVCYPATQAYPFSSAQEEVPQTRVTHDLTTLEYPETFPATQTYLSDECLAPLGGNHETCVATQAYSMEEALAHGHPDAHLNADASPKIPHQPARGSSDNCFDSSRDAALEGCHASIRKSPVRRPAVPIFPPETQPITADIWAECATQVYPMEEALANSRSDTILDVDAVAEIQDRHAQSSADMDSTAFQSPDRDEFACTQHYSDPPCVHVATPPHFSNVCAGRAGAVAAQDDAMEEVLAKDQSCAIRDVHAGAEVQDQSTKASADVGFYGNKLVREDAFVSTQVYAELAPESEMGQPALMPAATRCHEPEPKRQRFYEDLAPTQHIAEPPMTQVLDCDELLGSSEDEQDCAAMAFSLGRPGALRGSGSNCRQRAALPSGGGKFALSSPALLSSPSSSSLGAAPKWMASPKTPRAHVFPAQTPKASPKRKMAHSSAPKGAILSAASARTLASPSTSKVPTDNFRESFTAPCKSTSLPTPRTPKDAVEVQETALLLPSSRNRQSAGSYEAAKNIVDGKGTKTFHKLSGKALSAASHGQDSALVITPPKWRPHAKRRAEWTPLRRLHGKQSPPKQAWTGKRTGISSQQKAPAAAIAEERGRDLFQTCGHTLRPAELGQQVAVFGDGWGCGKGYFVGVVTEADRFTFTVVTLGSSASGSTGRSEEVHVLREFCALLSPGDPRAEAASSQCPDGTPRKKSGAVAEASSSPAAATVAPLPVAQSPRGASRAQPKRGKK